MLFVLVQVPKFGFYFPQMLDNSKLLSDKELVKGITLLDWHTTTNLVEM